METLVQDYKNGMDIYSICEKYHFGKIKVKKILLENGIEIRKRGGQLKDKKYLISDWKHEKYKIENGYHYIAISKTDPNFITLDYMNQAGVLTSYIKNVLSINIPTLYDRREYYKVTGNYWWEQWFNIVQEKDKEVKHCPYCNWVTTDIENKSGTFQQHILLAHKKNIDDYLKEYPNDLIYFKKFSKEKERKMLFLNDDYYVTCPLCNEKLKKITLWHCKSKHNMSLREFRKQFENQKVVSNYDHIQDEQNFKLGNLVVSKNRFVSKYEKELQDFLLQNNVQFEANRQVLIGKEIDLLIENSKVGIEFNGLKFHTERFGKKNKNYHLDKTIKCNAKGYKLIHIFEDEYVHHREIVLSKLSHILHLDDNKPKICGRKTIIKEIYKDDAQKFLNTYHIQGFASSSIYLGAFYNDELVAVMSFKHGSIKNHNWELTRFATNYNYIYQGIGGKLFNYFIRNYEPNFIVSFADRRWTVDKDNNLYTKLGFRLDSINAPDYRYYNEKVDRYKRVHKMTMNKQSLHKKYGFPLTMTEKEMVKELEYDKIWDCGLFKFVWEKEKVEE